MNRISPPLAIVLLFTAAGFAQDSAYQTLFDGKSLDGWHGDNPHTTARAGADQREQAIEKQQEEFLAHWYVEDGELVSTLR